MENKKSKFNLSNIDVDFFESEEEIEELEVDDGLKKYVGEYLLLDYSIQLSKDNDQLGPYWVAEHPDLPGCKSHGVTKEEALKNLNEAKVSWMYSYADLGKEIPKPYKIKEIDSFSGKILLRLPKELHYKLSYKAKNDGISLNQEILYLLSSSFIETDMQKSLDTIIGKLDRLQLHGKREMFFNEKLYDDKEDTNNILFSSAKTYKAIDTNMDEVYKEFYERGAKSKNHMYEDLESSLIH